ncbi:hypothetical protein B0I35DRAFT_415502 [Stachybotrys elegans]|uniref:Helicase C-terminal domain-containing protein n=1 Tax=Stachybotrys elegans TaxID=80388 RepID=A0A8K0WJ03_9HYPO|nr:hypothetical protein B0I35DRAFT_415502 [Stachybotrys elegans]
MSTLDCRRNNVKEDDASYFGLPSRCKEDHTALYTDDATLEVVMWTHGGYDLTPRKLSEWLEGYTEKRLSQSQDADLPPVLPWYMSWSSFCHATRDVGGEKSKEEVVPPTLVAKLPFKDEVYDLSRQSEFHKMVTELFLALRDGHYNLQCQAPPGVILICTPEQADKWSKRGWVGCVPEEFKLAEAGKDVMANIFGEAPADDMPEPEDVLDIEPDDNALPIDRAVHALTRSNTATGLADDKTLWLEACAFFGHDPHEIKLATKLPGWRITPHGYQMLDAYKMVRAIASGKFTGTYNASEMGAGKTLETLLAASIIALAHMCKDDVRENSSVHTDDLDAEECPRGAAFGIACYCRQGSLTHMIASKRLDLPQLLVCLANTRNQWAKQWSTYLLPTVDLHDAQRTRISDNPLIVLNVVAQGGTLEHPERHITGGCPIGGDMPSLSRQQLLPTFELRRSGDETSELPSRDITVTLADVYAQSGRCKGYNGSLINPTPIQDTVAGNQARLIRTRVFIVVSSNMMSKALPALTNSSLHGKLFVRASEDGEEEGAVYSFAWTVKDALQVSALYYDEWTEGRGAGSNIIKRLTGMCCNVPSSQRPIVSLLSGTPMPKEPKDLLTTLPLVIKGPLKAEKILEPINAAYKKIQKAEEGEDMKANLDAFQACMTEGLSGVMFFRILNKPFLGVILDPRPPYKKYPNKYVPLEPALQLKIRHQQTLFQERVRQLGQHSTSDSNIWNLKAFRTTVLQAVTPGMVNQPEDWNPANTPGGMEATPLPRPNVSWADCSQLRELRNLVAMIQAPKKTRHVLTLSIYPATAALATEWLRQHLSPDEFRIVLISARMKVDDRPGNIRKIMTDIKKGRDKRAVVICSTYTLIATGVDGLQRFMTHLIFLGMPWTIKDQSQAIARLWREGQEKEVCIAAICGAEGSIDHAIAIKLRTKGPIIDAMRRVGLTTEALGAPATVVEGTARHAVTSSGHIVISSSSSSSSVS